jgi:hypothetical protein
VTIPSNMGGFKMAEAGNEAGPDDEEHIDGCSCCVELQESEATPDAELPAASGGVIAAAEEPQDQDGIDGCDTVLSNTDGTTDEELPAATGGIG